jgi:hypothetical protein
MAVLTLFILPMDDLFLSISASGINRLNYIKNKYDRFQPEAKAGLNLKAEHYFGAKC